MEAGELAPLVGLDPGLLAELAPDAVERRLAGRHAAFGDLPRHDVERVAVLPDEEHAIGVVEDDDAGGEVRVVDDAVDAGRRRRAGVTSSCQTVIQSFS